MAARSPHAAPAAEPGPRLPLEKDVRNIVHGQRNSASRARMRRLAADPPQALLLEGGTTEERLGFSLYWACLLNCLRPEETPCLRCAACQGFLSGQHPDFFFFDGREQSIKIDELRALRPTLGELPRSARQRVVLLFEAQAMGVEAANSQLKVLEEPRPGTRFILTAPQRERLLPTLVSRSWILTLPWPVPGQERAEEAEEWLRALAAFWRTGAGLFERTAVKGGLEKNTAEQILVLLQRELALALRGQPDTVFSGLDLIRLRQTDELLAQCQEALNSAMRPAACLEWLATFMYARLHPGGA